LFALFDGGYFQSINYQRQKIFDDLTGYQVHLTTHFDQFLNSESGIFKDILQLNALTLLPLAFSS
jgi:hypothetical protein